MSRATITDHELPNDAGAPLRYVQIDPRHAGDERPLPLVIGLHYGWAGEMPPRHARDYTRVFLEPVLQGQEALIVAPYCPERTWHHPNSVEAVLALREHAIDTLAAQSDHVVLAGYSLGGMGTWYLGSRFPHLFAAGIAVAAVPILHPEESNDSGLERFTELVGKSVFGWREGLERFPLWVVNSRADELIPCGAVERAIVAMQRRGAQIEFRVLDDVGHYDSRHYVEALRPVVAEVLARTAPR
jgi:predicted peptidase